MLVDRQPMLRRGLAEAAALIAKVTVVVEASNVTAAMREMPRARLDMAVVDAGVRGEGGLGALLDLAALLAIRVLLVTSPVSPMPEGALDHPAVAGAMLRSSSLTQAAFAIGRIAGGHEHIDEGVKALVGAKVDPKLLTARQHQLLALVADGLPNSAIAVRLSLSVSSINAEMQAILRALGASDRTEAVLLAMEAGLLPGIPRAR